MAKLFFPFELGHFWHSQLVRDQINAKIPKLANGFSFWAFLTFSAYSYTLRISDTSNFDHFGPKFLATPVVFFSR